VSVLGSKKNKLKKLVSVSWLQKEPSEKLKLKSKGE
jgi:hypothetical protein